MGSCQFKVGIVVQPCSGCSAKHTFPTFQCCHLVILMLMHGCKTTAILPWVTNIQALRETKREKCFFFLKETSFQNSHVYSLASGGRLEMIIFAAGHNVAQDKIGVLFLSNNNKKMEKQLAGTTVLLNSLRLEFLLQVSLSTFIHSIFLECPVSIPSLTLKTIPVHKACVGLWHYSCYH